MKKLLLPLCFLFSVSLFGQHAFLDQAVIDKLHFATDDELIAVFLILENAVDVAGLEKEFKEDDVAVSRRGQIVIEALMARAEATQPAVVDFIHSSGFAYRNIQRFWIANAIAVDASSELIVALANREDIAYIELNAPQFSLIKPKKDEVLLPKANDGAEPGLAAIGAREMWAMGYTGQGRKALTFDTGIWPDHPAIKNRFLANRMPFASTWLGYDSPVPIDKTNSHGTHVTGIMLGLDTMYNDTIGVAPGAYFIATDPIVSNLAYVKPLSDLMLGFEWAMNPDGDVTTTHDMPDVINNSWGRDNGVIDQDWVVCSEMVINVFNAVQAAGIANVFSAGNEGPDAETIGIPHNINTGLVNSFTVGAVNGNILAIQIANFSSRGPSLCGGEGSLLIKPEVVAPGVNVRSAVGNEGEYDIYSGTSMAAPHVSGAVLLLKEAFPYLSGEDLLLALYYTATDLGLPGEDNTFGMGMINVKAAYDYLAEENEPVPPAVKEKDLEILNINQPEPGIKCKQNAVTPIITIRNNGLYDETGVTLYVQLNGEEITTYSDASIILPAGEDVQLALPEIALAPLSEEENDRELYVYLNPIEGDYDLYNNHHVVRWKELAWLNDNDLFYTDFENGIPDKWMIDNPDYSTTWDTLTDIIQADGSFGTVAWLNFRTYSPVGNQKDRLISPVFSYPVANTTPARLSFNYFYRKTTSNVYMQDTLVVYVAICGDDENMYELFRKGGADLYTTTEGPGSAMPQSSDQWQYFEFNLSDIDLNLENEHVYFIFEGINRRGNHLLIDNINFELVSNVARRDEAKVNIFPNPAKQHFVIQTDEPASTLMMYDIYGREVLQQSIQAHETLIFTSPLSAGIYLVRLNWKNGSSAIKKVVIE